MGLCKIDKAQFESIHLKKKNLPHTKKTLCNSIKCENPHKIDVNWWNEMNRIIIGDGKK